MNFYSVGCSRYVDESAKEFQHRLDSPPKTLVIYCVTYSVVTCVLFSINQVSACSYSCLCSKASSIRKFC